MVARNVSLGCSIRGTTSSKILATLQMTMKSLAVCQGRRNNNAKMAWHHCLVATHLMQIQKIDLSDNLVHTDLMTDRINSESTYVALCCQIGLHCHGVFDHQLSPDFAEQVQGGDARDKPRWVYTFILCRNKRGMKITQMTIFEVQVFPLPFFLFRFSAIHGNMEMQLTIKYQCNCKTKRKRQWV